MKILIVVNDPAYGSERPFNALRLAGELARRDGVQLQVFLMGDAVTCAIAGQSVPNGYYTWTGCSPRLPATAGRWAAAARAWTRASSRRSSWSRRQPARA